MGEGVFGLITFAAGALRAAALGAAASAVSAASAALTFGLERPRGARALGTPTSGMSAAATGWGAATIAGEVGTSSTTPTMRSSGGGPSDERVGPRPPRGGAPRGTMPRGTGGIAGVAAATDAVCAAAARLSCSATGATSAGRATSKSPARRRKSITSWSCASLRIRSKLRSLRLSLSRPSRSKAFARTARADAATSPLTSAVVARRTRSNASCRVRRSPLRPTSSRDSARGSARTSARVSERASLRASARES